MASLSLAEAARPILDQLSVEVDEMCSIAVLDGKDIVHISQTRSDRVLSLSLHVGSRLPAYCVSAGRVLLAMLADAELINWLARVQPSAYTAKTITAIPAIHEAIMQARRDGWSIVDEEYEVGFRSLSVPIRDVDSDTALNICCPTLRAPLEVIRRRFLPLALEAAREIAECAPARAPRAVGLRG